MAGSKRGFASMDPEKQKAIAAMGGKAVSPEKRSFSKNKDLAKQAGKKGGRSVSAEKRSFSKNLKTAAEAGRKGGINSARARRKRLAAKDTPSNPV